MDTSVAAVIEIQTHLAHPQSEYVIRFEREEEPVAEILSSNLLEASAPMAEEVETAPEKDLVVEAVDIIEQANEAVRFPTPERKTRSVSAQPIIDRVAVDDLIGQLEYFDEAADALDEHDEPLLTLDDLIDDVAIAEELADVQPAQPKRRARVKKPRVKAKIVLPAGWTKTLAVFVGLSFVVVLPIHAVTTANSIDQAKGSVIDNGLSAMYALEDGAEAAGSSDFVRASQAFSDAASSFEHAQNEINTAKANLFGVADLLPSTGKQIREAERLLTAGEALSRAASTLADGMSTVANRVDQSPAAAVTLFDVFVEDALPDLAIADRHLSEISISAIPVEHRETIRSAAEAAEAIRASMTTYHESADAIKALLGHQDRQRYLVVFQNNTELRPTGGFIGSFAEIDVLDGELVNITIPRGGTYDVQGQLTQKVQAPQPLQLLTDKWEMQDVNWFPDFPTSAKKAMWFYEASGGPTVDGVIAINANLVADLIDATGEIHLPEYGMSVDGETFLFQAQKQVEIDYDKEENQPKGFIADLAPILLDRMVNAQNDQFIGIADILSRGLSERDIQMYHNDEDIQSAIRNLGWDGSVLGNTGDYLMVVHANIGGGKTDGVIDDHIEVESTVRKDGRIENLVTVTRNHRGLKSSTFSGKNNVTFTRIYVPRGSTLLSVTGAQPPEEHLFESVSHLRADEDLERIEDATADPTTGALVAESFGKTSFGHWIQTQPGTSSTLSFRYLLPEDILDEPKDGWVETAKNLAGFPSTIQHSILVQKQPGVDSRTTHYSFNPGTDLKPVWSNNSTMTQLDLSKNTDGFFGMVLER